MFYNFNRHKQQGSKSDAVAMDELVRRFHQRRKAGQQQLANRMNAKMARLPIALQRALFFTVLGIGASYCIYLVLPNTVLHQGISSLSSLASSQQTIRAASPSPKQQAFQHYLDSLERAFVADSIFQSQQITKDHAENSIHP